MQSLGSIGHIPGWLVLSIALAGAIVLSACDVDLVSSPEPASGEERSDVDELLSELAETYEIANAAVGVGVGGVSEECPQGDSVSAVVAELGEALDIALAAKLLELEEVLAEDGSSPPDC